MTKQIVFGGGCFWCLEAVFQDLKGVEEVISGYSGGIVVNPTYEEVSTGVTGHAEVVQITYDDDVISLMDLLDIFWHLHDPTTLNKQGSDVGTQYRSVIFYDTQDELDTINESRAKIEKEDIYTNPIVTQIEPLTAFYPAEDYHQNYFKNHPNQGYCQIVIDPKIAKLRRYYFDKLKNQTKVNR
ncbi:MAG: peptide-methionine (S)-S-oxide reductase MsrA [Patescibacteria group bacterium]